tara:strand:- start:2418 stop:3059 length:642 start_codon:yes stop_codon:yes gene_type:complete
MKVMTEKQYERRRRILAAARKLVTEKGYDGLKMRELAEASGVTPKTLYHQFGSKEKLVLIAVEERYRHIYQAIDDAIIDKGIERLYYIIETVAEVTRNNIAYARGLGSILSTKDSAFTTIRMSTYRKALDQIQAEGDFVDWLDVKLLNYLIYSQVTRIYFPWWYDEFSPSNTVNTAKLDVSMALRSVTKGYTFEKTTQIIKSLMKKRQDFTKV